jgi:uncharacterized protein
MNDKIPVSRRRFLQASGTAGLGALFLGSRLRAAEEAAKMPRRSFGRTGIEVSSNTAECLSGAAQLDLIDAAMVTYSYRDMQRPEMRAALEACTKRGIGLTAMKTMGGRQSSEKPEHAKLLEPIQARGFTPGQAKLKLVLENPQIACACVQMPNLKLCRENIAAGLDRKSLGAGEKLALARHAEATCNGLLRFATPIGIYK